MQNRIKLDDFIGPQLDIDSVIKETLLNCSQSISKDSICLEIDQGGHKYTIGTYKNFSCTVGAQKSRKTFFSCMLMAPAVINGNYDGIIAHTFGRINIFFDTEQANYHAQSSNRRISSMSGFGGNMQPPSFNYYGLRKYNYLERLTIIKEVLSRTKKPGLVIIDGIRDLVSSVNDEQQATEVIGNLMEWTTIYDCHINIIIHLTKSNKYGESSPRGWLGTEIQNKAESVIEVRKSHENPRSISEVLPKDFRGIEFDEFKFTIKDGIPHIIDAEEINENFKLVSNKKAPY